MEVMERATFFTQSEKELLMKVYEDYIDITTTENI